MRARVHHACACPARVTPCLWSLGHDAPSTLGHDAPSTPRTQGEIAEIVRRGEQISRELRSFGFSTAADHAAGIFAYTEENANDLYGKLNHACRTPGGMAEMRLETYRDYLHHMAEATSSLINFVGKVYRGIDCKINPESYGVGNTITWQQVRGGLLPSCKRSQHARARESTLLQGIYTFSLHSARPLLQFSSLRDGYMTVAWRLRDVVTCFSSRRHRRSSNRLASSAER